MMRKLIRRLRYLVHRDRHARELAEEMDFHRSMLLRGSGRGERGGRSFGNATLAIEEAREIWLARWLEAVRRDLQYGVRILRREPIVALTTILTLAFGATATITAFSVADAELWKPVPFPQPSQLVAVNTTGPGGSDDYENPTGADFLAWRSGARLAEYAATGQYRNRVLRRDTAELVAVLDVSGNFFDTLRVHPAVGRVFSSADERGGRTAILGYQAWTRLFHANPAILGTLLRLDGDTYTVVGVSAKAPLEFVGHEPDVYVCMNKDDPAFASWTSRSLDLDVFGRLAPRVSIAQADAELEVIQSRNAAASPAAHRGHAIQLVDFRVFFTESNPRPLLFFLGAAVLVLILSCGNAAHLLLARALRRRREFAVRAALGGGAIAIVRQLAVEGALVAIPAAAFALILSSWALSLLTTFIPPDYLSRGHLGLDARTAVFTLGVTFTATLILAFVPVVFARRVQLNATLGSGTRSAGDARGHVHLRHTLVVSQLSLTLVLLVAAGLFMVSFERLSNAPLGFEPHGRIAMRITASAAVQADDRRIAAYAELVRERARSVAGIRRVTIDSSSPLASGYGVSFLAVDRPPAAGSEPVALQRSVGPEYFNTLGIILLAGRTFTAADGAGAPRVAIVNEALARTVFGGTSPIGKTLELLPGRSSTVGLSGRVEIVGVVANAKDIGINEVDAEDLYLPFAQAPMREMELVASTSLPPEAIAEPLRRAVAAIDPAAPVAAMKTLDARVNEVLGGDRFNMLLIVSLATLAILLASVGIYGTMAYAVQQRTREFGVRLALGARPGAILTTALWESGRLGLLGSAIGTAAALVAARLFGTALYLVPRVHDGLLYSVSLTNPGVLGGAAAALAGLALLAGLIPARQAMRVDPAVTLRE